MSGCTSSMSRTSASRSPATASFARRSRTDSSSPTRMTVRFRPVARASNACRRSRTAGSNRRRRSLPEGRLRRPDRKQAKSRAAPHRRRSGWSRPPRPEKNALKRTSSSDRSSTPISSLDSVPKPIPIRGAKARTGSRVPEVPAARMCSRVLPRRRGARWGKTTWLRRAAAKRSRMERL
jgi:hypothetical protein